MGGCHRRRSHPGSASPGKVSQGYLLLCCLLLLMGAQLAAARDIMEPLACYICNAETDNEMCNSNGPVECESEYQMCMTEVLTDQQGVVIRIEKSSVIPSECRPGCRDGMCTYCCNSKGGCNEPDDGPIEDIVEPLACYTCNATTDNEMCNSNGPVECGFEYQMCMTEVLTDQQGVVIHIEKSCVIPSECRPGCRDGMCTYCCNSKGGCNEPDDGPIEGL